MGLRKPYNFAAFDNEQRRRARHEKQKEEKKMSEITKDTWKLGEHEFSSRFILGSGKYSLD